MIFLYFSTYSTGYYSCLTSPHPSSVWIPQIRDYEHSFHNISYINRNLRIMSNDIEYLRSGLRCIHHNKTHGGSPFNWNLHLDRLNSTPDPPTRYFWVPEIDLFQIRYSRFTALIFSPFYLPTNASCFFLVQSFSKDCLVDWYLQLSRFTVFVFTIAFWDIRFSFR